MSPPVPLPFLFFCLHALFCSLDIRADIEEAADKFLKAVNTKDLEALAKLYVDDCLIMIPGTPVKFGKDGRTFLHVTNSS